MGQKKWRIGVLSALLAVSLTGCGEGQAINNTGRTNPASAESESTGQTEAESAESESTGQAEAESTSEVNRQSDEARTENDGSTEKPSVSEDETQTSVNDEKEGLYAGDILQLRYWGVIYQVDSWSLYDSLEAAGATDEDLEGSGISIGAADPSHALTVTMTYTNMPDDSGQLVEETYVNCFCTVTQAAIDASYLPEPEPDTQNTLYLEYGGYPVYLNIGHKGEKGYFRLDAPAEGESMTYTIGFVLTDEEYEAAKAGELYLWYTSDDAQSVEDLQMLYLSLNLFQ